ncbi:hypothetical protein [Mycobacterium sp.]|uniref:hypothetical protein n=1 Tax=Mycobacterium sp. TaxID=1785 RepID=UPI003D09D595
MTPPATQRTVTHLIGAAPADVYAVELGDGPSMFNVVTGGDASRRAGAKTQRLDALARDMAGLLDELDNQLAPPSASAMHPPTNQ